MKTDQIKLLYEYNGWANGRILTVSAKVNPEQYVAPTSFGLGYGSLRATLVHILDAEWEWRLACQNYLVAAADMNESSPSNDARAWDLEELTETDVPTLDALNERWQAEEREMQAYLASLGDEQLNGVVRYKVPSGTVRERLLWHCLYHVVNHGTQHRSEAAALLTSYGQSPGDVDFTVFLNEHVKSPSSEDALRGT